MNKFNFELRSRYRFLLLCCLLVVLLGSLLLATFRTSNTDNLNTIILELSSSRKEAEQVEKAIKLLYSAENNFRTFVLTGNKANFRQYAEEIKRIEDIFYEIEENLENRDDLPGLFKDKKEKTEIFIMARLLADSLIKNSVSWDTSAVYTGLYTEQYKPKTVIVSRVDTIISSQRSQTNKKFFGRIRDAISNRKDGGSKKEVKVVKSTVSSVGRSDSDATVRNVAQKKIADLRAMTLSLKKKEFELLESNNKLFGEIKDFLEKLRSTEFKIAKERNVLLSNNAGSSLKNLTRYYTWQFLVILLLITCVAATLYWIYRNDLKLIQEARQAAMYAKLKSEFVFTTSHEIRSPIYVMQLYAEQLSEENLSTGQRQMLDGLTNSAKMTLAIVNRILDTMEVEYNPLRTEIFSPEKAISDVIHALGIFSNQKDIALTADTILPSGYALIGDEFRLKQILVNLISNAFKFTDKGQITVKCRAVDDTDPNRTWLKISVEDTGVGIPDKYLETVFEQFAYLNVSDESSAQMKSNGLGLYIVKNIIDEHKGRISIQSKVGEGSVFTFEIPYQKVIARQDAGQEVLV